MTPEENNETAAGDETAVPAAAPEDQAAAPGAEKKRPSRRKRRPKKSAAKSEAAEAAEAGSEAGGDPATEEAQPAAGAGDAAEAAEAAETAAGAGDEKPAKAKRKRPSRSSRRRKKAREEAARATAPTTETGKEELDEELDDDFVEEDLEEIEADAKPSRPQKKDAAKPGKTSGAKGEGKKEKEERGPQVKLLINAEEPEECRIAQVEAGRLESFHVTTLGREQTRNNIYKARVSAIEPNLQVAFVDYGMEKNGFLPLSEIHPEYFDVDDPSNVHWKDVSIQDVIHKGQEMLVQVVKEPTGNKGASMTTFLSLPGRFLVLMPGSDSSGISRKIEGEEQRNKLREMIDSLGIPEGIGYIVRTASEGITKTALTKDVRDLLRVWREIKKKGQEDPAPALLYGDQDIVAKFMRDYYTPDIQEILVDTEEAYNQVNHYLSFLPAKQKTAKVKLHMGSRPIFNHYDIEEQIEAIYKPVVKLPSGGSIVINPTEALVAIDVNSGRTGKDKNFEETIFLANMEAATEIARQLRLRDLGGLIVIDFIDMRSAKHTREVEKEVKNSMKRDKAKADLSRISRFGLMQISRQKMGSPIQMDSYLLCEHCQGRGMTRSVETQALYYLRQIQTGVLRKKVKRVECRLPLKVGLYLLNRKRRDIDEIERNHDVVIAIEAVPEMRPAEHEISFHKGEGQ